MSENTVGLHRKIKTAGELQSVVRTMKALASSSIGQYENSVQALADYYRTVELALGASLREIFYENLQSRENFITNSENEKKNRKASVGAIVFGSDQGLVGKFNEEIVEFAMKTLSELPVRPLVWAVGERVQARLMDAGLNPLKVFAVPNSVQAIAPLVGQIQVESEAHRSKDGYSHLLVFHNRPRSGSVYEPAKQRLLPLDRNWRQDHSKIQWPSKNRPEVLGRDVMVLSALIREYLYISLFKACAESLASENASRLAAMQRADKNIDDSLKTLEVSFHRLRQSGIDEELFDVIAGFQALVGTQ
jgi:F-type H+-transporting ATPase subunit gamma